MLSVVETASMTRPGSFPWLFCFWAYPANSRFRSLLLIPACTLLAQLHNLKRARKSEIIHTSLTAEETPFSAEN